MSVQTRFVLRIQIEINEWKGLKPMFADYANLMVHVIDTDNEVCNLGLQIKFMLNMIVWKF